MRTKYTYLGGSLLSACASGCGCMPGTSQRMNPNQGKHLKTYLGSFNMVVEIIAEGLDVGDVVIAALRSQVSGEQNYVTG